MSTVSNPTGANAAGAALSAAQASTKRLMDDTQDRFLTLLVTQLQNQDPLNPMDNAEVTSQIAQLSTVNGINQLNNTLLALSGQMDVSQSIQSANLIGKDVLVPGSKISLGAGPDGPVATPFGVDLISPAASVKVSILDAAGRPVREMDLGPQSSGIISLDWDGKGEGGAPLPEGAYSVQVVATGTDGAPVGAGALTYGRVSSVAYSSNGLELDLGLAGKFSLLDIRKIM